MFDRYPQKYDKGYMDNEIHAALRKGGFPKKGP